MFTKVSRNETRVRRHKRVDKKEECVVSKTTHFTDMINGVIQAPESPQTEGFAPTMMNDIKAADPTMMNDIKAAAICCFSRIPLSGLSCRSSFACRSTRSIGSASVAICCRRAIRGSFHIYGRTYGNRSCWGLA